MMMWAWQTALASALGTAIPLIPIYLFGFRQLIQAKDGTIAQLRNRIEALQSEHAPTVVLEKRTLIAEIEARAKEKLESEAKMERETAALASQIEDLRAQVQLHVEALQGSVKQIPVLVDGRVSRATQVAIMRGRVSLVRVRYWLTGLTSDGTDALVASMHAFLDREQRDLHELQLKIRDDHYELKIEDFRATQADMDDLREQAQSERRVLESKLQPTAIKVIWDRPK